MSEQFENVTIKAAQSFGGMRAGEVVTVSRTSYIEGLIERGRVTVVDSSEGDQRPPQSATADDLPTAPTIDNTGFIINDPAAGGPPARNAETIEWAEYMGNRWPDYDPSGKTRTELIAEYDERVPPTDEGDTADEGSSGDGSDQ